MLDDAERDGAIASKDTGRWECFTLGGEFGADAPNGRIAAP